MNLRLAQELADIRARFGSLDRLTADELEEIVECCRRADAPFGDANAALADAPAAVVRGVEFRPLTIGASVWLDEYAVRWWGEDDNRYFWALVYALIHGHDPEAFRNLVDEEAARKAIVRMSLRFAFGRAALENAVDAALGRRMSQPPPPSEVSKAATDWNALVSSLEANSGIPRDDWLWGRSADYTLRAYTELHRFAASHSGMGGNAPRMFDALDEAINALARAKKKIKDRIAAEDAAKGTAE